MKVRAVLNPGGGTLAGSQDDAVADQLAVAFETQGIEAEIRTTDRIAEAFADAASADGIDAVVAGGGDGTVSCAAAALAGTGRPLGIIPLGTLNHLARDAGIPLDLDEAAALVATGRARRIDLGEVNGRTFVNNSAIGLYPRIVRDREAQEDDLGRGKRRAMLAASFRALRGFGRHRLTVRTGGQAAPMRTPLLFVGNNRYETSLLSFGRRKALDGGGLCLYAPLVRSRLHLLGLGLRGLFGLAGQRDFLALDGLSEILVESPRLMLSVSVDGEVERMETPLCYRIRPGALRLIMPECG
jgi:diacylglycerol kinase family enzyme